MSEPKVTSIKEKVTDSGKMANTYVLTATVDGKEKTYEIEAMANANAASVRRIKDITDPDNVRTMPLDRFIIIAHLKPPGDFTGGYNHSPRFLKAMSEVSSLEPDKDRTPEIKKIKATEGKPNSYTITAQTPQGDTKIYEILTTQADIKGVTVSAITDITDKANPKELPLDAAINIKHPTPPGDFTGGYNDSAVFRQKLKEASALPNRKKTEDKVASLDDAQGLHVAPDSSGLLSSPSFKTSLPVGNKDQSIA